jgi:PAS domain S-box-containing protein
MGILASKGKVSTLFSSGIVDPEKVKVLRESEERYRSLVESSGFGIATTDFRGRFTFVNEALCKMIGYSRKELIGKHFASFLHSEDKQRILKVFLNAWKHPTEKPSLEFRVIHKKGHVIHMYSTPTLHRRSGKILGFNAIIADITERKQMEESLRESEDRYRSIVELAPDGVVTVDMGGIITSVNAAFSTISGYSKDEIIGRHFTELGALRANNIPEYLKLFDLTKVGTALPPTEFAYNCKDGTERWGEAHIGFVGSGGKRVGLQGILRDITERKEAERIILENQQKFERLFMGNPEAAVYWDSDFRVLAINPRFTELFGYLLDEIKGKSNVDIIVPRDKAEESAFLGKMSREGYVDYDTIRKRKDGSLVHVSLSCAPIMIEGKLVGLVGLYKDITERKRMEDALKESEKRYRTLFESTREAVLSTDADGSVLFANPAALTMLGYAFEEFVGKPAIELYQNPMQRKEIFKELMEKGYVDNFELTLKKKDSTYVYVLGSATVRKDSEDRVLRIESILRNITERKKAEKALRESEERYRELTESISDVFFAMDKNLKYTYWNKASERLMGIPAKEAIGKSLYDLFPNVKGTEVEQFYLGTIGVQRPQNLVSSYNTGGKSFVFEISAYPTNNGLSIFVKDITERREMEEKLRQYSEHLEDLVQKRTEELSESEKRYSVLVEEANDGVIMSQDERVIFANKKAAETLNYSRDKLVGLRIKEVVDEKYYPLVKERYHKRLKGIAAPSTYEIVMKTKTGQSIPIELSSACIDYQSRPAILVVLRDIKERKQLEEQRLKLERLAIIGELATMVAHDLRNPLTSIKNVCFYLKSTCPPRDGAECKSVFEMVEILEQETAFANAIINDLLDFAVKRPLEKKRKNINNIINSSLKKANMAENVKIERDFALRPIANVDEEQLTRVFLNLIKNAAQAMPEGGRLTVGTSVTADRVEVVVRDTGTGIAKENMSKIFQPLFTTKAKGIGMGLAICKRIVEEHSATIDVESEVGKGTAFLIKLPKNVEALAQ